MASKQIDLLSMQDYNDPYSETSMMECHKGFARCSMD